MLLSLSCRVECYNKYISLFPSCATVISFSSGIIILFCYCCIISHHERKNKIKTNKTPLIRAILILVITSVSETQSYVTSEVSKTNTPLTTPFIALAIAVVILTIKTINIRIFSPLKSLNSSYYKEN